MELEYLGGNCIKLTTKKGTFLIDEGDLVKLGQKAPAKAPSVSLCTTVPDAKSSAEFVIDSPGEYEISDVSVQGIAARGLNDESGSKTNTIYRLVVDDVRIVIAGNVSPELSDSQLEAIGTVDILFVPVGGAGVALDGLGALKLIRKIEPKMVIPTYYADKGLKYDPIPVSLEEALKAISMEPTETLDKLKLKGHAFAEVTQLVVLNRQ